MMNRTKKEILSDIPFDYLLDFNIYTKTVRNKYPTKKEFVSALIRNLRKEECKKVFSSFKGNNTPKKTALKLLKNKANDRIIREKFVLNLIKEEINKITQDIVFFEFPVDNNRTDICRINGSSHAYEIKSNRDELMRAINQTRDFLKAFEYVRVIVNENIDSETIKKFDSRVGFIKANLEEESFHFIREAKKNRNISPKVQIDLIQRKELREYSDFSSERKEKILKNFNEEEINTAFKKIIKKRYKDKWVFYSSNSDRFNIYC